MEDRIRTLERYGSGGATSITFLGLSFLIVAILLIFVLPRRHMIFPLLSVSFFMPLGQKIVVAGLHFYMFRIILIFAWLAIYRSGYLKINPIRLNPIDKALIYYSVAASITFCLLWGDFSSFINRLGFLYNVFGLYFLLRFLLRDQMDVDRAIKAFATISAVIAIFMITEHINGRNLFSAFGGVPQFTDIRDGKLRSQGAFEHPILAGTYGGIVLALFIGQWWVRKSRALALLGIISAIAITVTSSSSTAISAAGAGLCAFFFWPLRRNMRIVRRAVLFTTIALHLVMKAPVWALIGRFDFTGSSSGYHRYQLVNEFILNFNEWWLWGVRDTGHWGYDMWDTSNQYVEVGVTGGLISLVLFLTIFVRCYRTVGTTRMMLSNNITAQRQGWALGAALFAMMVGYVGIAFFDQTMIVWYAVVAMIASLADELKRSKHLVAIRNIDGASHSGTGAWNPDRREVVPLV